MRRRLFNLYVTLLLFFIICRISCWSLHNINMDTQTDSAYESEDNEGDNRLTMNQSEALSAKRGKGQCKRLIEVIYDMIMICFFFVW